MPNALHDIVIDFLEEYRSSHSGFIYWLRERNTGNRLTDGYWFQGNSDYAFVGLYDRSGGSNRTRSVGLNFSLSGQNISTLFEVVFNEEQDKRLLNFYAETMKLLGGFNRLSDTRFQKLLSNTDGLTSAKNFLEKKKPLIDDLIRKLNLIDIFINEEEFKKKLENILTLRGNNGKSMFPVSKFEEVKKMYEAFKQDDFYKERIRQLKFIPFAKKVIVNSLKGSINNETLTGLIQILKNGARNETVNYYLNKNIVDINLRSELKSEFSGFGFTGYTGAGKTGINDLDDTELEAVKKFILDCSTINTREDAIRRVEEFDSLKVPQIKCGVYSPWLYYLNPTVFPIKNNSHDVFIQWCNQPKSSYPTAFLLFHEVSDILGEKDLGLIDAFTHMFTEEIDGEEIYFNPESKENTMALNSILYGPPGTGKTYQTISKAVAIANPQFNRLKASRYLLKSEYERLVKEGQVDFITFHQSFSYEDFIEGIKPVDPNETGDFLKYEVKDGIFKRLCERAARVYETKTTSLSITDEDFQKASFYKMSLGDTSNPDDDQIYDWCIKNGYIALGRGDVIDFTNMKESDIQQMVPEKLDKFSSQSINYFIHYAKKNDYVIVTYGNLQFRAVGKITGDYEFKKVDGLLVHQFRKVKWLWNDRELPYEEIYDRQFQQQSIYKMDKRGIRKEFLVKGGNTDKIKETEPKNYVLIIDEINRGNISQIFGELITLIEDDKRAGKSEALTVILPYSKKSFSVPSNLYIIGTMNTADRSVEALDTALRRRFAFEFMDSQPQLLSSYHLLHRLWFKHWLAEPGTKEWKAWEADEQNFIELSGMSKDETRYKALADKYEKEGMEAQWLESKPEELFAGIVQFNGGVDLSLLLKAVNERLEVLLSKDHTIGHAWLMSVFSLEDLKEAFRNKIIPLLQEFFFKDYAKIGLVLGSAFLKPRKVEKKIFANFKDENELAGEYEDTIIYTLSNTNDLQLNDFISIYK